MSFFHSIKLHLGLLIIITAITYLFYHGTGTKLDDVTARSFLVSISSQANNPGKHDFEELMSFIANDNGKAFYTVNLYRFHLKANYPANADKNISGEQAFASFSKVMLGLMARQGAHPIFSSTVVSHSQQGWDRMVIVRYPSRTALLEIFSDPSFVSASNDKWAAIEKHERFIVEGIHLPDLRIFWFISCMVILYLATKKIRLNSQSTDRIQN